MSDGERGGIKYIIIISLLLLYCVMEYVLTVNVCYCNSNRLRDFSEWGQCQIMELLRDYQPVSEDEVFDLLVSRG